MSELIGGAELIQPAEFDPVQQVTSLKDLAAREIDLCDVDLEVLANIIGVPVCVTPTDANGYQMKYLPSEPPVVVLGAWGGRSEIKWKNNGVVTTDIVGDADVMMHGVDANNLQEKITPERVQGIIAENINFKPTPDSPGVKLSDLLSSAFHALRESGSLIISTIKTNDPTSPIPKPSLVLETAKKTGYQRCVVAEGPTWTDYDFHNGEVFRYEDARVYYLLQKGIRK